MSKSKKKTLSEMSWHGKNLAMWREKSFVDIDMGNLRIKEDKNERP